MTSALYRNDVPGQFPPSWYAATTPLPPERPPLAGEIRADVCIIGAGYTGLSAALTLREAGLSVVILDAQRAGWGASGRNGGQVGTGYNKDQRWLQARVGAQKAGAMWDLAEGAKALVAELVARHAPDANLKPGVAHGYYTQSELDDAKAETDFVARNYGYDRIELYERQDFRELVQSPLYHGGDLDRGAAHLHPLRLVLGLARAAEAAGATIHERSEVHAITHGDPAIVRTGQGRVVANHVIVAGNGYMPKILNRLAARVMPVNSFIGATAPLGPLAAKVLSEDIAACDSSHVVNYFRLTEDSRLLFGGRANYSLTFPRDIGRTLHTRMVAMFPQLSGVRFDYTWGGSLGVTMTRLPCALRLAPNVLAVGGYSGHGVALSCMSGKVMAEAIAGQASRFDTLSALPTTPFPLGTLAQETTLTLAMLWFRLRDILGK